MGRRNFMCILSGFEDATGDMKYCHVVWKIFKLYQKCFSFDLHSIINLMSKGVIRTETKRCIKNYVIYYIESVGINLIGNNSYLKYFLG